MDRLDVMTASLAFYFYVYAGHAPRRAVSSRPECAGIAFMLICAPEIAGLCVDFPTKCCRLIIHFAVALLLRF